MLGLQESGQRAPRVRRQVERAEGVCAERCAACSDTKPQLEKRCEAMATGANCAEWAKVGVWQDGRFNGSDRCGRIARSRLKKGLVWALMNCLTAAGARHSLLTQAGSVGC